MNEVKQQLYVIFRWIWLLILGTVLGAAIGYYSSNKKPIIYQSSAKIMVNRAADASAQPNAFYYELQMTKTYMELVNTRPVLQELNRKLDFPVSAWQISALPIENTLLFWIVARDNDPQRAALIANSTIDAYSEYLHDIHNQRFAAAEKSANDQIAAAEEEIARLREAIDSEASVAPTIDRQQMESTLALTQQVYADLFARRADVQNEKTRTLPTVSIIQPASPPATSIPRQRPQAMFTGGMVGLLAAIALVLVLEFVDDRLRTPEDVDRHLSLPVLGLVGKIPAVHSSTQIEGEGGAAKLPMTILDAFQTLDTNLDFVTGESPSHTVLITSPGPGEGKSTVAQNLALTQARAGHRTVLLDLNLRQTRVDSVKGITFLEINDLLSRAGPLTELLPAWSSPPILAFAACQMPPDPVDWLRSEALNVLLEDLKDISERIIVDGPSGLVADPMILAAKTDSVLVVIESGKTHIGAAQVLVEQLRRTGALIAGAVLNIKSNWAWLYYSRYNNLIRYYQSSKHKT